MRNFDGDTSGNKSLDIPRRKERNGRIILKQLL
jgi:hypothetical protein